MDEASRPTFCPMCWGDLIVRAHGRWCPLCRGWLRYVSYPGEGGGYWWLDQGIGRS